MNESTFTKLKEHIRGEVILPGDEEYDTSRNVFNRAAYPAVIVRCKDHNDVAIAIRFAQDNDLTLSVRSGGHASNGTGTNDDGMVIDVSHFNTFEVLDAKKYTVRIGAGMHWGDAAKALDAHGLAISSGDTNSVGVSGLTLGGGVGWQVRKFGLAIDNLIAAELVTADGRVLRVSETEHPDLFWAIRGGGGNFGVVTSFDFRAHPLKHIIKSSIVYPIAEMEAVLTRWAEYMRNASEEINSTLVIIPGFGPEPVPMMMVLGCATADDEAMGHKVTQPLLELGTVQHQEVHKVPYYQMLEDASPPPGMRAVTQNGFIKTLDEAVIKSIVAHFGRTGTPILQIRALGGAMDRINVDATAFAHRGYDALVWVVSLVPADTPKDVAERKRQESWRSFEPFAKGAYINFSSDVGEKSVADAYPPETYARLADIKAKYDPGNIFNQNANIKPAKK